MDRRADLGFKSPNLPTCHKHTQHRSRGLAHIRVLVLGAEAYSQSEALIALRTFPGTRIHPLALAQKERLRAAVQSVHAGLSQRIGADWLDEARAALAQAR